LDGWIFTGRAVDRYKNKEQKVKCLNWQKLHKGVSEEGEQTEIVDKASLPPDIREKKK